MNLDYSEFVSIAFHQKASDLLLKPDHYPMMKVDGKVIPVKDYETKVSAEELEMFILKYLPQTLQNALRECTEIDYAFAVDNICRARANLYRQRGRWAMAARLLPVQVPDFDQLGLSPALSDFAYFNNGMIIVSGSSGSGKTTTLTALIDIINQRRQCHIITIEDPIEIVFEDKLAYISQRELDIDTVGFHSALRALLREAPDVISIGEMRDAETVLSALQAAETGHLVLTTLHTASAYETLERLASLVPMNQKERLFSRLSKVLRAVIAQKLIPKMENQGRVLAQEILIGTPTTSKLIEEGNLRELYNIMSEGEHWGMQTMNQSLVKHVKLGTISGDVAMQHSNLISELKLLLRR